MFVSESLETGVGETDFEWTSLELLAEDVGLVEEEND